MPGAAESNAEEIDMQDFRKLIPVLGLFVALCLMVGLVIEPGHMTNRGVAISTGISALLTAVVCGVVFLFRRIRRRNT